MENDFNKHGNVHSGEEMSPTLETTVHEASMAIKGEFDMRLPRVHERINRNPNIQSFSERF